jgi:hypothetical protein
LVPLAIFTVRPLLLAGAIGALGYGLHCHDDSIAFIAIARLGDGASRKMLSASAFSR